MDFQNIFKHPFLFGFWALRKSDGKANPFGKPVSIVAFGEGL
tara:strand:- start:12815 stop:12940 length:126 start_codon:yes stop_codon:yes gene_type:complete